MNNAVASESLYNPHAIIAVRRIDENTKENTFPLYKATDVEEVLNRVNLLEQRIGHQEKQIGKVIDNLSKEGWYSDSVDKEDVLSDLCEIFDHEAKEEVTITATVQVSVRYDIPLNELEDFDAKYFLQDNLTIDSWHGDVVIDSFDVEDADIEY